MEYTNDVIFNVKYKSETDCYNIVKYPKIHKILKKLEKDNYFKLTILISIIFLFIDCLIIRDFIMLMRF